MAATDYTYTISTETANGKVVPDILEKAIHAESGILIGLSVLRTDDDVLTITMKDALDSAENGLLTDLVNAHTGANGSHATFNPDGVQLVDVVHKKGPIGSKSRTLVSHDFSDRRTWVQRSVRVTDEVVAGDSAGLVYTAANAHWIDIYSSKLSFAYNQIPLRDGTLGKQSDYEYVVKIDDVVTTTGFTVDYTAGEVTFDSDQSGNTVKLSYSHNDGVAFRSEFIVSPAAGKVLTVEHVECQFSVSTVLNGACRFEVWAGNTLAFFDGAGWVNALFDGGYGQYRMDYRNFVDFINVGNLGTGSIPQLAGHSSDICVFPFNYTKSTDLKASTKAIIRVMIVQDLEATNCDIGTVTFYTEENNE